MKVPGDPPISIATIHLKQQKHRQHKLEDSSREASLNRGGRSQGDAHQNKKKSELQPNQNQHRYESSINVSGAAYSPLHQQIRGAPSPRRLHAPQIYQQYSDAGSLYSYPPQHHDQSHQFRPDPQYANQQHLIYQQFHDLQQRHAHQMILLQQQHESRLWDLEQTAAQTSIIPDNRADSFESGADYLVPTSVGGMVPTLSQFNTGVYSRAPSLQSYPPAPHPSPPQRKPAVNYEYRYDSLSRTPVRNVIPAEVRSNTAGVPTTDASVISPPLSPAQSSRPAPQPPRDSLT